MPEAYHEAQELLREVRRLRPQWLRATPNLERVRRFRFDWMRTTGGFWDRARSRPELEANALQELEQGMLDAARSQADSARQLTAAVGLKYETAQLCTMRVRLSNPIAGWDGSDLEPWRVSALSSVAHVVRLGRPHAYLDWLEDQLDLEAALLSGAPWVKFWFHDVLVENMPRFWLRWAFETLQSLRRVTDGTPCDAQLGTYLTECGKEPY